MSAQDWPQPTLATNRAGRVGDFLIGLSSGRVRARRALVRQVLRVKHILAEHMQTRDLSPTTGGW